MCATSRISGATVQAYLETEYIVFGEPPIVLCIGVHSLALAILYEQYKSDCAAYVTACNPRSKAISDRENRRRYSALEAELTRRGYLHLEGVGRHPTGDWTPEPSYLVLGLSPGDAKSLGSAFDQNAIVWCGANAIPELMLLC